MAAEYHFEYCGLCDAELENEREWDTGVCDDCGDLGPRYERDRIKHPIEALQMTTEDGKLAVTFPDGARLLLALHVTEWTHDEPEHGEPVEMQVETDFDDSIWWYASPKRADVAALTTEEHFPQLTIEPEIERPEQRGDD